MHQGTLRHVEQFIIGDYLRLLNLDKVSIARYLRSTLSGVTDHLYWTSLKCTLCVGNQIASKIVLLYLITSNDR